MATLPAGYIPQRKQCCRMVDSVANTVRPSVDAGEMITPALELGTQSSIGAWPNSLDQRPP